MDTLSIHIEEAKRQYERALYKNDARYGTNLYNAVHLRNPACAKHHPYASIILFLEYKKVKPAEILKILKITPEVLEYIHKGLKTPLLKKWADTLILRFQSAELPDPVLKPLPTKRSTKSKTKKTTKRKSTKKKVAKKPTKVESNGTQNQGVPQVIVDAYNEAVTEATDKIVKNVIKQLEPEEKPKGIFNKIKRLFQ